MSRFHISSRAGFPTAVAFVTHIYIDQVIDTDVNSKDIYMVSNVSKIQITYCFHKSFHCIHHHMCTCRIPLHQHMSRHLSTHGSHSRQCLSIIHRCRLILLKLFLDTSAKLRIIFKSGLAFDYIISKCTIYAYVRF
jgi:hypothetical protein